MAELWIKRRCLHLNSASLSQLHEALGAISGFRSITQIGTNKWQIEYDVKALQFREIANALKPQLPASRWWQLKAWLYQYQDENHRDALQQKDRACCNRPPPHR